MGAGVENLYQAYYTMETGKRRKESYVLLLLFQEERMGNEYKVSGR